MRWEISTPPAAEPVSLTEMKEHLRITSSDEDSLITNLIVVAREHAEAWLSRCLITQDVSLWLNAWPQIHVSLPVGPALTLSSISTFDADDAETAEDISAFYLQPGLAPRLFRKGTAWPSAGRVADGVKITYSVGFGPSAADVPPAIRHGILLMGAYMMRNRGDAHDKAMALSGAERLWRPYRVMRMC